MKCLIVFCVVVAVASAQFGRPQARQQYRPLPALRTAASARTVTRAAAPPRASSGDQNAEILRYESAIEPEGSYSYSFETSNGIAAQEQGTPRNLGSETPNVAQGSYSFTSPDGVPVSITYVADENGFQPQGDVLPVAPPVPPQIARALDWLARNAPAQRNK